MVKIYLKKKLLFFSKRISTSYVFKKAFFSRTRFVVNVYLVTPLIKRSSTKYTHAKQKKGTHIHTRS